MPEPEWHTRTLPAHELRKEEQELKPASPSEPSLGHMRTREDVAGACDAGDPFACWVLAEGAELRSGLMIEAAVGEERERLESLACELDSSGTWCAAALQNLIVVADSGFELRRETLHNRKRFAHLSRLACDRADPSEEGSDVICELAAWGKHRVRPGNITGLFPKAFAGFTFGMTRSDAKGECEVFEEIDVERAACAPPPVDPFRAAGAVLLTFCEGALCDIGLSFSEAGSEVVAMVQAKLTSRYGEPAFSVSERRCPTGRASAKQRRMIWVSGPHRHNGPGMITLSFECQQGDSMPTLSLWYRDQNGLRWRKNELDEINRNY